MFDAAVIAKNTFFFNTSQIAIAVAHRNHLNYRDLKKFPIERQDENFSPSEDEGREEWEHSSRREANLRVNALRFRVLTRTLTLQVAADCPSRQGNPFPNVSFCCAFSSAWSDDLIKRSRSYLVGWLFVAAVVKSITIV
ncbi:hypothetical protein RRG08_030522 [Elysia crispata]|uniref:Uncharacterized protein n=1 Tax=Elysia crispata TaxID=231223 RepID=A0AAE0YMJ6_9GAST|nr:hypothetical protein RRG08_030522 [Elysia crispata]